MNFFNQFHAQIAGILSTLSAAGTLPSDLDASRMSCERFSNLARKRNRKA